MPRCLLCLMLTLASMCPLAAAPIPGFQRYPFFGEQFRRERTPEGVRVFMDAPGSLDPAKPTLVVFYATPNGNTIEQTLGCRMARGTDWHFDIQHIAAQTRLLRRVDAARNIVLVVVQPENKSWPAWRAQHADNGTLIRGLVDSCAARVPGSPRTVALTGHSGGGSFLFGYLNGGDTIPDEVERIAYLDANYSYSEEDGHGAKLLAWLKGGATRHLVVLAYDDRSITLDGKPVVGPTGGTWRATFRMVAGMGAGTALAEDTAGDLVRFTGLDGRIRFTLDRNPANKILHTVLVETNGFTHAMTAGGPLEGRAGAYRGPRAYTPFIQPAAATAPSGTAAFTIIPPRTSGAKGGRAFMARIARMAPPEREAAILEELERGNVPAFLRTFKTLSAAWDDDAGRRHTGSVRVMPDVLAVGSDEDFVRLPMTPRTAQALADAFGCSLITRRVSDLVAAQAELRLEPRPLTKDREAVPTFVEHNEIIEAQRAGKPLGLLTCGDKKDVVLTSLLAEKPGHVAIYGWHYPAGDPIQPLTAVHIAAYVDYSHGIRLMDRRCMVDGRACDVADVLKDPRWCGLLSDEGPVSVARY